VYTFAPLRLCVRLYFTLETLEAQRKSWPPIFQTVLDKTLSASGAYNRSPSVRGKYLKSCEPASGDWMI
jgi:hypothetical protein